MSVQMVSDDRRRALPWRVVNRRTKKWLAGLLVGLARGEATESLSGVAGRLLAEGWSERYSARYLEDRVLAPMVDRLRLTPAVAQATAIVDDMVDEYEAYDAVQVVWLPVRNLTVRAGGVDIGSVTLREVGPDEVASAEERIWKVMRTAPNAHKTQGDFSTWFRERFASQLLGVVAEVRVTCTPDIAVTRARASYDELMDFLNAATTLLYALDARVRVGAVGEVVTDVETVLVMSEPLNSFSLPMSRRGPVFSLDMNDAAVETLQSKGFWCFADILGTPPGDRTPTESDLLLALHWYADCQLVSDPPANKLLSLTIAAEVLFPRGRSGIGFSCAEGLAFLLSDNADGRYEYREAFQSLYARRGDIAHQGQLEVSDADVYRLTNIVIGALLSVAARRRDFRTMKDLAAWVDAQRLS